MAQWVMNPRSIREDVCLIPGLNQWVEDPAWLWCGLVTSGPIQPLAWGHLYAARAALKSQKQKRGVFVELKRLHLHPPLTPSGLGSTSPLRKSLPPVEPG